MEMNTMALPETNPDVILLDVEAASRQELFIEMIDRLVSDGLVPKDQQTSVLEFLEAREAKISTAIGSGIALPHTPVDGLPRVVTMLARTKTPIHCNAPDGDPVSIFFLVLLPGGDYATHLRTIAAVASFFRRPEIRTKLLAATDSDALMSLFA